MSNVYFRSGGILNYGLAMVTFIREFIDALFALNAFTLNPYKNVRFILECDIAMPSSRV